MKTSIFPRPLSAGVLSFTVATAMTSVAAMAACGGAPSLVALAGLVGPPSITATEASTDQALELIRKRREEASGSCPAGFARSGGNCVPVGGVSTPAPQVAAATPPPAAAPPPVAVTTTTTTTTTGPAAATAPQAKRPAAAPKSASVPGQVALAQPATTTRAAAPSAAYSGGYSGGSLKDTYAEPMPGTLRAHGVWVEGYYDQEKRENLNPGRDINPSRRMVSGGVVAGVDSSRFSTGSVVQGYQLGFFSGYNSSRGKFSDTLGQKTQSDGSTQQTLTTNARQEIDGAFAGLYGSYVQGRFSMDAAFKIDFFDIEQRLTEQVLDCGVRPAVTTTNTTAMTNYIVASNANYRFGLGGSRYLEPTVGLRYTHVDFGGNAPALGVRDGDVFRVQGGLRLGNRFVTPDGWIWQTALTGLLYSDVSMSGLVANNSAGLVPNARLVDEGQLRAMGILESRVDVGYGYTLYGDVEVRGGQDYFGFGTRAGVRYQW